MKAKDKEIKRIQSLTNKQLQDETMKDMRDGKPYAYKLMLHKMRK